MYTEDPVQSTAIDTNQVASLRYVERKVARQRGFKHGIDQASLDPHKFLEDSQSINYGNSAFIRLGATLS